MPRALFDDLHTAALAFFRQPEEVKRRYAPAPADLTRRGWTTRFRAGAGLAAGPELDTAEAWTMNPHDPALGWRPLGALPLPLRRALLHPTPWPDDRFRPAALPYFLAMGNGWASCTTWTDPPVSAAGRSAAPPRRTG